MAVKRRSRSRAYGIDNALQDLAPQTIVAQRAPSTADQAEEGTTWINETDNEVYMLSSYTNGSAGWLNLAGGAGVFDSIEATTGNITADVGDIFAVAGDIIAGAGDITAATGAVNAASGAYNTLNVGAGGIDAGGTFTLAAEPDGVLLTDNTGLITATQGTDGQLLIGATGAAPVFANLTSSGMTITITEGANTINLDTAGAAGTTEFEADDLSTAVPVAGVIVMAGASGVTTSAAGDTVTFALDDPLSVVGSITAGTSVSAATTVTAGTGVTVTTGNAAISSGSLTLPTTSSTDGQIILNSNRFVHAYGTNNFFAGSGAGNFTLTGTELTGVGNGVFASATTVDNSCAIGYQAATSLETGTQNAIGGSLALQNATAATNTTAFGYNALNAATSSTANTAIGSQALSALLTGSGNTCVGYQAGINYTGAESNNVLIHSPGVTGESNVCRIGNASIAKFFVRGVYGVTTDSATTATVLVSDEGQLGTISSSRRYKENIEDMGHYDDNLMKLRPVTFEYKSRPGRREYGLIAEEVNEVYPDLVNLNQEGQPDNVQYFKLSPMMLNQLKKMAARIESLEEKASKCSCRN